MLFAEFSFYRMTLPMPASPLMYGIIELHDHIFFFLNMILFIVLFLLATTVNYFNYLENSKLNKYLLSESVKNRYDWIRLKHGSTLEIVWTVIPSIILVFIAIPSFALLYATDELVDPAITIHVIGHQWYWSYEYNDLVVMDLQSYYLEYEDFCDIHNSIQFLIAVLGGYVDLDTYVTIHKTGMYTLFGVTHDEWGVYLKSNYVHVVLQDLYEEYLERIFHFENSNLLLISADKSYDEMDFVPFFPGIFRNHFSTPNSWLSILSAPIIRDINFTSFAESLEWGITGKDPVIAEYIHGSFEFDSYLKSEDDLKLGEQRLYETDFPLVLPKNTHIRFMITSDDVIHSWSVPALGIKVDAVPGRINHAHTYIKRSGIFYGQCSELCGVNHAFMPIQIIVFEPNMYYNYLRLVILSK